MFALARTQALEAGAVQ